MTGPDGTNTQRDRDPEGRARNARPRDGLGRPLPYGAPGVERQPEGVVRSPADTVREAQRLLDSGMPFHAHEVFEDAWKAGPDEEAPLWRALAQTAVGLTHAARGNATGGARLLLRGAAGLASYGNTRSGECVAPLETSPACGNAEGDTGRVHGMDLGGLVRWARELAERVAAPGAGPVDAATEAPRLGGL